MVKASLLSNCQLISSPGSSFAGVTLSLIINNSIVHDYSHSFTVLNSSHSLLSNHTTYLSLSPTRFAGQNKQRTAIPWTSDTSIKMRFQEIVFSSLLFGATVLAAELNTRFIDEPLHLVLAKRQQFKPQTTTAEGATCADAFGQGYETCK
jgi:hypothetical protein